MTKDENIQKAQELEIFEAYRKHIDEGRLQSFAVMNSDVINEELERICNAALLSRNTEAALNLTINLAGHKDRLTPENWAILSQTNERLKSLAEKGGWLPIIKDEDSEEEITVSFPRDVFPEYLERYLDSVAANVQVDRAMICAAVLAVSALCMQGRFKVAYPSGNGHSEHLCLYIVIVADPGERKSSTFEKALVPVRQWQKARREQYKLDFEQYKLQNEVLSGSIESQKKKLSDKKLTAEQRQQIADELTSLSMDRTELKAPISPEIIATDTTVEALAGLLAITGESAGIFTDEADFLKIIAGLYNKGTSGNLQLVLGAYDGSSYSRLRGAGTISLSRPLLSMCLFAQPALFDEIKQKNDLKGRGMIGRLLFCTPKKMAGLRDVRSNARIDKIAEQQYIDTLETLLDTPQKDNDSIPVLSFEKDAAEYMLDHLQKIEDSIKAGNPMEEDSDYASKAGGVAVRIAGILHMLHTGNLEIPISLDTAIKAVQAHLYFFGEKLKELQQEETREQSLQERVMEKLWCLTLAQCKAYTTASALQRKVKNINGLKTARDLEPFLDMIQSSNFIDIDKQDKNKRLLYISPYFQK